MDSTNIKMPPADTVNPILKHPRDEGSSDASKTAAASAGKSDKSRHIVWDEHAIEEHDLLRGTRMKVRLFFYIIVRTRSVVVGLFGPVIFKLTNLPCVHYCKYTYVLTTSDIQNQYVQLKD